MALVERPEAALALADEQGPRGQEAVPRCSSYARRLAQEIRDHRRGGTD
jgi:hypothetical protein